MKRKLFAILLTVAAVMAFFAISTPAAAEDGVDPTPGVGTSYYYDSVNGSDSNDGLSPESPKKDPGTQIFPGPGDTYFFAYGSSYNHGLEIIGSGSESAPITITAYGDPENGLPTFNGTAHSDVRDWADGGGTIKITKQSYITVEKLKLTHYNPDNPDDWKTGYYRRSGVWLIAQEGSTVKGITLRDLEITQIMGMSITKENSKNQITMNDKIWVSQAHNAAIQLNQWDWTGEHAHFEDLLVENCYIHDINTVGIQMDGFENGQGTNVVIRNNVINKTGADGIVIGRAGSLLIENNVVYNSSNPDDGLKDYYYTAGLWVWACNGVNVIQNNEVAYTKANELTGNTDAAAFDTDIMSQGDYYWQYNYTHDNDGGFYFNMGQMADWDPNGVNYIRYNISENDKRLSNFRAQMNLKDPTVLTNNVFYNDIGGDNDFLIKGDEENVVFANNVFYQANSDSSNILIDGDRTNLKFSNNALFGYALPQADDGSNLLFENGDDMGFVNIGTAGDAWTLAGGWQKDAASAGYKLKADSPLINAGKNTSSIVPEVEGVTNGGRDYFGNPVDVAGLPDIGVYETGGDDDLTPPAVPTNLAAPIITDESVSLTWNAKDEDGIPMDAWIYRKEANSTGDFERITYVVAGNSYVDNGLEDETEYIYRVTAVSNAGMESESAAEITVKTAIAAIIINVNDTAAGNDNHYPSSTGEWISAGGAGSYENTYMVSEDSDAIFTWNIDIKTAGYYNVYYWQPNGNQLRTRNAIYTINHADESSVISVDQRKSGGQWVLISSYLFNEGATTITLENGDSGLLNAGAVRLVYAGESQDTSGIGSIQMNIATTMLKVGEKTVVSFTGIDELGRLYDLSSLGEDAEVTYEYDSNIINVTADGTVYAVAEGATWLTASVTVNGQPYEVDPILIQVGDGFAIADPLAAQDGDEMTITVPISNFTGKDKQVTVIAVAYDADKMMVSYEISEMVTLRSMNAAAFALTVDTADADNVKVFIWDTQEGMDPVAEPIVVE